MTAISRSRNARATMPLALLVLLGAPPAAARAQSEAILAELQRLHDRLVEPDRIVAPDQAAAARERLDTWKLDPEQLAPQHRAALLRLEVYVALGEGDAGRAVKAVEKLQAAAPEEAATHQAAYLVGCAAGDALRACDALAELRKGASDDVKKRIAQRTRWMHGVGVAGPDVVIRADDMTEFPVRRRNGRVLLIDFWNLLRPPTDSQVAALRALYEANKYSEHIEFVGVNADSETRIGESRQFAADHKFEWKQRYEQQSVRAPITHEAFHAGAPPWQVLIDAYGYVRTVGECSEPGFQYALRAALAEAAGERDAVVPRSRTGERPKRASDEIADAPARPKGGGEQLESVPEAAQKLTLARTYLRTGRKADAKKLLQEIVDTWPNSIEAKEAQEFLDSIP